MTADPFTLLVRAEKVNNHVDALSTRQCNDEDWNTISLFINNIIFVYVFLFTSVLEIFYPVHINIICSTVLWHACIEHFFVVFLLESNNCEFNHLKYCFSHRQKVDTVRLYQYILLFHLRKKTLNLNIRSHVHVFIVERSKKQSTSLSNYMSWLMLYEIY